jgi:pimeloyl-ACP methyl ester carboxylesterase
MLADQVADLVTSLGLAPATFYGCSSAGLTALSLTAKHATIVRSAVVHEAALQKSFPLPELAPMMWGLSSLDDSGIVTWCTGLFRQLNSKPDAWDALGPADHQRLEKTA